MGTTDTGDGCQPIMRRRTVRGLIDGTNRWNQRKSSACFPRVCRTVRSFPNAGDSSMTDLLNTTTRPTATGDALPPACQVIEVRVKELWQLFNAMDPSPFRQRDLDPDAAEFIIDWSREMSSEAPIGLVVHLERAAGRA